LADAGFVLEPNFEGLAGGCRDLRQDVRGFFLNASTDTSLCS
jgi:hypothetical protein